MMQLTQNEILEWSTRNFGRPIKIPYSLTPLLRAMRSIGEVAHHVLKDSQGIRGDHEHHERMLKRVAERLVIDAAQIDQGALSKTPEIVSFDCSAYLGMVEEVGELAHAILFDDTKEIDDAIADLLVYTLDCCGRNNKSAEGLLKAVWAKVKQRDWQKNNLTGPV